MRRLNPYLLPIPHASRILDFVISAIESGAASIPCRHKCDDNSSKVNWDGCPWLFFCKTSLASRCIVSDQTSSKRSLAYNSCRRLFGFRVTNREKMRQRMGGGMAGCQYSSSVSICLSFLRGKAVGYNDYQIRASNHIPFILSSFFQTLNQSIAFLYHFILCFWRLVPFQCWCCSAAARHDFGFRGQSTLQILFHWPTRL